MIKRTSEEIRFEATKGAPADTQIPKRGTKSAAGYDFYAPYDVVVPACGLSKLVHFNIKAGCQAWSHDSLLRYHRCRLRQQR